jgi:hypothetical protein
MPLARIPTWFFFACSIVLGLTALLMVLTAFSTASLHFGHCGPSSLSSPEQYCRGVSQLLIVGYSVGRFTGVCDSSGLASGKAP